jgi:eukaryotic translation initiation factor 2C
MVRLAAFLQRVRVRVTHIIRMNREGREIPRIKTITGLATPGDGRGLQYPPIVPKFAAGAKEVKFHLGSLEGQPSTSQPSVSQQSSAGKKGKKGKKPIKEGPEPPGGGYISVYDFFQRSKVSAYPRVLETMVNASASPRHHYHGSQYACYQCWNSAEPVVFTTRRLRCLAWPA